MRKVFYPDVYEGKKILEGTQIGEDMFIADFLLKQLNFNIPEEFPFDFIYIYADLLYPDNVQEIIELGIKVANDSYFTYTNNIYKTKKLQL